MIESGDFLAFLGVALTAIIGLIVALVNRRKPKEDLQETLMNQLRASKDDIQANYDALKKEFDVARTEMQAAIRDANRASEEAHRVRDYARLQISMAATYIYELRAYIARGAPPPPPEIPPELTEFLTVKRESENAK